MAHSSLATGAIRHSTRRLAVGQRDLTATVVEVPLGSHEVRVGLAGGKVGRVQSLGAIATLYQAAAAINGCFFDAYSSHAIRNPHHLLITKGRVVHRGTVGSVLGFAPDGRPSMGRVKVKIEGSLDGKHTWPHNWYAYWLNRRPENATAAIIYDQYWTGTATPDTGVQIVVEGGRVVRRSTGSQTIPPGGFVLLLSGEEKYLAERFQVGQRCAWRAVLDGQEGSVSWGQTLEAMGAGPRLVHGGQPALAPRAEGFNDPKILNLACNRSAVGLTPEGRLLLVTTGAATIQQLARGMQELGCREAMNLDGGASSGLWLEGRYLTQPGREISNALVIRPR